MFKSILKILTKNIIMKTLITFSILICTTLITINAQTLKLQSHMNGADWAESVLLNGEPLLEASLNSFPIQSFDVLPGTNTIEIISLPNANVNGVSTLDIVNIRRQLSDIQLLPVEAIIPSDVDQSGYIGVNDVAILRQLILGFSTENNFAFVHTGLDLSSLDPYDFGTEVYQFQFEGADFATTNFVFDVFVHGDTNQSAAFAPDSANEVDIREAKAIMSVNDITLEAGLAYDIPFTIATEKSVEGLQIAAAFDNISIIDVSMDDNSYDIDMSVTTDELRMSILGNDASNLVEGLISITANRDGLLSDFLAQESDFFDEIVYHDLSTGGVELHVRSTSAVGDLSIEDLKLSPNPMNQEMQISFPAAAKGMTKLQVMNTHGQLILTKQSSNGNLSISRDELRVAGVYILILSQDGMTVQKKFVVL